MAVGAANPLLAVPTAVVGQDAIGVVVLMDGEADLLEVVGASHMRRGGASGLHGGQKEADDDGDDGDDDEQLDQGVTATLGWTKSCHVQPPAPWNYS